MLNRKLKFYVSLFVSLGFIGVNAQSFFNVKENSGGFSSFYINDIRKLTFVGGNFNVNEIDGNSNSYELSSIRRLDFNGITTEVLNPSQEQQSEVRLQLYPNPVNEILYVKGKSAMDCEWKVEIIDLQGKVLKNEILNSLHSINVSDLNKGMFLCRIYTCDKIEIIKFLKN